MKRFSAFLLVFLLIFANTVSAEGTVKKIGIIIVGSIDDMNSNKWFSATKTVTPKGNTYLVKVGNEIQDEWNSYCVTKKISSKEPPKVENVLEFVEQNNFHRLLFLVVSPPSQPITYKKNEEFGLYKSKAKYIKLSVQTNAYLFDKVKLLKSISSVNSHDESWGYSDQKTESKAQFGAFKRCLKKIGKNIEDLW